MSMTDRPLNTLGVAAIVEGVRAGRFTARDVVEACLARIAEREPLVGAWCHLDAEAAGRMADAVRPDPAAPLCGVPFGAKDVLDSADLPTEMGSALYRGHRPRYDAACVALARRAGAVLLGKTVTAEFAGTQPTATRNPHDPDHTPGGSSSGSAAAVADCMVAFAFGTQTGGSVLRPAAYCGIVGFKPTFGLYPVAGMKPAAPSLDTVGLLARSVEDIALVHGALMSQPTPSERADAPRIGVFRSHLWETVDEATRRTVEQAAAGLDQAGAILLDIDVPEGFAAITEQRAIVNAFERARNLATEWQDHRAAMSPESAEVCERGFAIDGGAYLRARQALDGARFRMEELFAGVDVLLAPTAPGAAPRGLGYPGDPRLQELWTLLHLPSLSLPVPPGDGSLSLGLQLVGRRYADATLLETARWVEERL